MQSLWKSVWRFPKNIKTELPYGLLHHCGHIPKRLSGKQVLLLEQQWHDCKVVTNCFLVDLRPTPQEGIQAWSGQKLLAIDDRKEPPMLFC